LKVDGHKLYQLFKYSVYALLTVNIFIFFAEEWAALAHRFGDGMRLGDVIEGFAATIDTTAWVILLLMFELETWVLDDRQVTPRVALTLRVLRALCYGFIVYAFYGYLTKLLYLNTAAPLPGVRDLCSLVAEQWAYAVDLDEYEPLTFQNCSALSATQPLMQFRGLSAVVDARGYTEIVRLAWTDVINAGVWLGVVALLEIDVRLQEKGHFQGLALTVSTGCKYVFYSVLFLAAIYWGIKGDFVDFWDAFLWLVAFVFIEMNVFEWRRESLGESVEAA